MLSISREQFFQIWEVHPSTLHPLNSINSSKISKILGKNVMNWSWGFNLFPEDNIIATLYTINIDGLEEAIPIRIKTKMDFLLECFS